MLSDHLGVRCRAQPRQVPTKAWLLFYSQRGKPSKGIVFMETNSIGCWRTRIVSCIVDIAAICSWFCLHL